MNHSSNKHKRRWLVGTVGIKDQTLPTGAKVLLHAYLDNCNEAGQCFIGNDVLDDYFGGISHRTIQRHNKTLKQRGFIKVYIHRHKQSDGTYKSSRCVLVQWKKLKSLKKSISSDNQPTRLKSLEKSISSDKTTKLSRISRGIPQGKVRLALEEKKASYQHHNQTNLSQPFVTNPNPVAHPDRVADSSNPNPVASPNRVADSPSNRRHEETTPSNAAPSPSPNDDENFLGTGKSYPQWLAAQNGKHIRQAEKRLQEAADWNAARIASESIETDSETTKQLFAKFVADYERSRDAGLLELDDET